MVAQDGLAHQPTACVIRAAGHAQQDTYLGGAGKNQLTQAPASALSLSLIGAPETPPKTAELAIVLNIDRAL